MGSGEYSSYDRQVRATTLGYKTKSASEIFTQRNINNAMNPHGITLRESRDSDEHPNSLAIVVALDVTGSMGSVPHHMVRDGLPTMMQTIIDAGTPDPQVLFLGIGDHTCDSAPLQVGQFESSDALLDKWLTTVYLEGGGGGNEGESYLLAWYFAGKYTEIDCLEKRGQKGLLFTIGDEPVLKSLSASDQKEIMGNGQYGDMSVMEILDLAKAKYDVYHIHICETWAGSRSSTKNDWKQILGDNFIEVQLKTQVPKIIAEIVAKSGRGKDQTAVKTEAATPVVNEITDEVEILL